MLIIALVLAVIGLAALVTAVVTSNELIAWVCIGASVIGVILLIVDALRERSRGASTGDSEAVDYPDDADEPEQGAERDAAEAVTEKSTEDVTDESTEDVTADAAEDAETPTDGAGDDTAEPSDESDDSDQADESDESVDSDDTDDAADEKK